MEKSGTRVEKCCNLGEIEGKYQIGGILGIAEDVAVNNCYNSGKITATDVSEKGNSNVGGIIGLVRSGEIKDVYNIKEVTGIKTVGGVVGNNRGNISNAYNVGIITGEIKGGIVGNNDSYENNIGIIRNSYALNNEGISLFGVNSSTVGEECSLKSAEELKAMAGVLGSGFKNDTNNINNGYPILSWQ